MCQVLVKCYNLKYVLRDDKLPKSVLIKEFITTYAGIILGMGPANERRRYIVTSSLISWVHTQN